ncbi:MAG: DNA-binding domain-containing protein [Porticoccaceae bacterium]|nr:DNA-binding domain-containing protein [Porticoccaceae bacterium]
MRSQLQQRQQQMMSYLLSGKDEIAEHVLDQGKLSAQTRLHIYGNAYHSRLRDTIDTDHPATGVYLGDSLFELMVDNYRQQHASSYRSLRHFADALPHFLAMQTPFCDNPQISELARFERLLVSTFNAADASRATIEQLRQFPVEDWPEINIDFHPSVQLFESNWNAVEIWQAIKEEKTPPTAQEDSTTWLVWRNQVLLTEFRHLGMAEFSMFKHFKSGGSFASACEALLDIEPEDQVSAIAINTLMRWLDSGLVKILSTAIKSNSKLGNTEAINLEATKLETTSPYIKAPNELFTRPKEKKS